MLKGLRDHIPGAIGISTGGDSQEEIPSKTEAPDDTTEKGPSSTNESLDELTPGVQDGVAKIEAVASVWTKKELIISYAGVFLVFFINSLQQQTTNNLTAYVTSAFSLHSLVTTISIVSSIVGGVLKVPIAKMLDMWGRAEGYVVMMCLNIIGLIMMATCKNVETYAAAQVFYWVGFNGMGYVLDVFMADTSSLKNRALVFAFSTTPYIATTFAGPAAAQDFYEGAGWRWGHGVWTIIVPVASAPFLVTVFRNQISTKARGLVAARQESGRTARQSLAHYFWEFDLIGIVLICAGFVLVLLPLNLATFQENKWRSGSIISMLVIGGLCLIAFVVYERYFARRTFIPYDLLLDRTVLGACGLAFLIFVSFYCWDGYYLSYLQVVHNLSIKNSGYVYNIYNIGACFWAVVVAGFIRVTKRFKWLALYFALPLYILGTGLMIHFRQPHTHIGYVVMCQIFIAFAGGTLVICEEMAVMAAASHQNVAAVLAFLGLFSSVGNGVGAAVSGAIWMNTLPKKMTEHLPDSAKNKTAEIFGSLPVQLSYVWGSPEREAIIRAYGDTQRLLCITATCLMVLSFVCVGVWRNINVSTIKNTKGLVV